MKSRFNRFFRKLRDSLSGRIPAFADILPVFALIAAMFYGWTMVVFLWKLPGWLFFLNIGEIAGILAYQFTTNLLESFVILLLLLISSMIFPPRAFKDVFVVRGSVAALVLIGSMMLFLNRYVSVGPKFGEYLPVWMLGSLLLAIVLSVVSTHFRILKDSISWLSDRMIVFLFVLLPLTALSIFYVLIQAFI